MQDALLEDYNYSISSRNLISDALPLDKQSNITCDPCPAFVKRSIVTEGPEYRAIIEPGT
jgi:hypothetical protein